MTAIKPRHQHDTHASTTAVSYRYGSYFAAYETRQVQRMIVPPHLSNSYDTAARREEK
jgi:hypothetical protein